MKEKRLVRMQFSAEIEERLWAPTRKRWQAQFKFYPLGYFRGAGPCPGKALTRAWAQFRRVVHPGKRWWSVILGPVPPIRL